MDKETAVELERLKGKVETLEESNRAWNTLIKDTVIGSVKWLLGAGMIGLMYGWHLPETMRKSLADWISK